MNRHCLTAALEIMRFPRSLSSNHYSASIHDMNAIILHGTREICGVKCKINKYYRRIKQAEPAEQRAQAGKTDY